MKPAAIRSWLLAICVALIATTIGAMANEYGIGGGPSWFGLWGFLQGADAHRPYMLAITDVVPGGAAAQAGLRPGDLIDIRRASLLERYELFWQPISNTPVEVAVTRGGEHFSATVRPHPVGPGRWDLYLQSLGYLCELLLAAVILVRRPFARGNLLLAAILVLNALGVVSPVVTPTPWLWAFVLTSILSFAVAYIVPGLLVVYAGEFGAPQSMWRRFLNVATWVTVALTVILTALVLLALHTLVLDPVALNFSAIAQAPLIASEILSLLACALAIRASHGEERTRATWSLAPFFMLYGTTILYQASLFLPSYAIDEYVFGSAVNITQFVVPSLLTYAALNRRVLDIGFVLNRAAVFALVSTIVVGGFVAIEWAIGTLFTSLTHETSAFISLGTALALGLSLRPIHEHADRFVDRVIFHKRHENEAALRRFAHESSYITSRDVLLERTIAAVRDHSDNASVAIYLPSAPGQYACVESSTDRATVTVSENDPAIVALRAWHKPIDVHTLADTALAGEYAYPMVSRGTLVGVLACGAKGDGESYAPDESEALLAVAQGVGHALDAMDSNDGMTRDSIAQELARLRTAIEGLAGARNPG